MVDRVLWLLDQPGSSAVCAAAVDWNDAFSRTDPTLNIQKLIDMGCRPTLVSIIIEFLDLKKPIYYETAHWGAYGNGFKWDKE